jgi:hypothetical protein
LEAHVTRNPLAEHPPWRQLVIVAVVLPLVIVAAVLAFAWPAGRIAPRDLPVGIVGASPAAQQVVESLDRAQPGGFDFHLYADDAAARTAIEDRDVYGAFETGDGAITAMEASAASPTVAQLLTTAGQQLAARASQQAASSGRRGPVRARAVDVVPVSTDDPRGLVLSSALLPLTICSILVAAAIGLVVGFRPAWRQVMALTVVSAVAGGGAYLMAQSFLGALPHEHLATWSVLTLTVLAISATTAGLIALVGSAGLAVGAALMVFVGNPFSGVTSAPQMMPDGVDHVGQWLPPGAGASLLRSTAYFGGNGSARPLTVLLLWMVFGVVAIVIGHHTPIRFAAHPDRLPVGRPDRTPPAEAAFVPPASIHVHGTDPDLNDKTSPRHLLDLVTEHAATGDEQRPGAHEAG